MFTVSRTKMLHVWELTAEQTATEGGTLTHEVRIILPRNGSAKDT
jgi:hypothetical protein